MMSLTKDSFRTWPMPLLDILLVSTLHRAIHHKAIHHKDTLNMVAATLHMVVAATLHMVVAATLHKAAILHKAIHRLDILLVHTHQLLILVHQLLIQDMEAWGQC